jgi:hypothetical protein
VAQEPGKLKEFYFLSTEETNNGKGAKDESLVHKYSHTAGSIM